MGPRGVELVGLAAKPLDLSLVADIMPKLLSNVKVLVDVIN